MASNVSIFPVLASMNGAERLYASIQNTIDNADRVIAEAEATIAAQRAAITAARAQQQRAYKAQIDFLSKL